jgi:hypothetical protein
MTEYIYNMQEKERKEVFSLLYSPLFLLLLLL